MCIVLYCILYCNIGIVFYTLCLILLPFAFWVLPIYIGPKNGLVYHHYHTQVRSAVLLQKSLVGVFSCFAHCSKTASRLQTEDGINYRGLYAATNTFKHMLSYKRRLREDDRFRWYSLNRAPIKNEPHTWALMAVGEQRGEQRARLRVALPDALKRNLFHK